jgi:hypothetical protein
MKCSVVTIRVDGLDEGVDLLPVGVPERPAPVLVLRGIHGVMCASTHAHREGNARAALRIGEWVVAKPPGETAVQIFPIANVTYDLPAVAH